jgi:hypothetical protein
MLELFRKYVMLEGLEEDKSGHLMLGLLIGAVTTGFVGLLVSPLVGALVGAIVSVAAGAGKEYLDSLDPLNHTVDKYDAIATIAGGFVGSAAVLLLMLVL